MTQPLKDEKQVVDTTKEPITRKRLVRDLHSAGVKSGDILLVHSSMSNIGWIVGGAVTAIAALMEAVTERGTIVMPTQTTDNGEPSQWQNPPVPENWWATIREEMPAYDSVISPTRKMGIIVETFRKYPEVFRSPHPQASFAAWGRHARYIVEEHTCDEVFGENSPLGKLYELRAKILLIGIGYNSNTSLHYAETRANLQNMPRVQKGAAALENGKRVWKTWIELDYNDEDFPQIAEEFERKTGRGRIFIGQAESHIFPMRELIDFGVEWLRKNRRYKKSGTD